MDIKEEIISRIKNWRLWSGIVGGGIFGYLYYYYVGCASGSCAITSNPYISVLYGSLLGVLLLDSNKKKTNAEPVSDKIDT